KTSNFGLQHGLDVLLTHFRNTSVQSARRRVNGVELHYRQTGHGGHAALLLPGSLGTELTKTILHFQVSSYRIFTVLYICETGCTIFGRSKYNKLSFPLDFFDRDAKDAVGLMKALNFKTFSLLGWSDGGITALIAAAKFPTAVRKLVVWGANAFVSEEDLNIYNALRDVSAWSERMRAPMRELYGDEYFAQTWQAWVDGISQFAQRPDGSICRELLPQIACPTLIVHGEKDPMVPRFHAEYLLQHIKGSRLHLMPEGKHNLHLRFAGEFNNLVEEFLCL
uniref:Biphenyl hydrolase like n=1 Tax=Lepisosteus oculatus TaxID=7918 RepID=W5N5Y8_LEPOC